jgi:hypothetical protein
VREGTVEEGNQTRKNIKIDRRQEENEGIKKIGKKNIRNNGRTEERKINGRKQKRKNKRRKEGRKDRK